MIAARNPVPAEPEVILYTNHRGETAVRRIRLDVIAHGNEAVGFGFGSTQWHPGEQLLFSALDVDKGARRTFAMAGVKAWGKEAVAAALASSSGEALRAIRFATKYIDDHWDRAEFFEAFLHGELTEWPEFTSSAPPVVAAETFATIAAWAEATFGPITPERTVARADEEMVELRAEPGSVEEAADVVICLARYANLWAAVERKMAVNRKRQWRRVGDGTGYHIKPVAAPDTAPLPPVQSEAELQAFVESTVEQTREFVAECDTFDADPALQADLAKLDLILAHAQREFGDAALTITDLTAVQQAATTFAVPIRAAYRRARSLGLLSYQQPAEA